MSTTALLLSVLPAAGCGLLRSQHDAPVDPSAVWTTHLGDPERAAFSEEPVPVTTPQVLWESDAGRGLASAPVLSGEVLLAGTTGRTVIALSAESGKRYWEHRKQGPLSVGPVVDREHIYVSTGDVSGRVYALRRRDGGERWKRSHPGVGVPLLLDGQRLYLASRNGYLTALRSDTGESVWNTFVGAAATAPVLAEDRIVVGTSRDSLFAVDASSGRIVERRGLPAQVSAPPALRAGILYLPLQNGELVALRAADFEELWSARAGGPILAAPVVSGDGTVYVLDRTGDVHSIGVDGRIRTFASGGSAATGSLALAENALLVGLVNGTLMAFDRDGGETLWTVRFGDSIHSPTIIRDGDIYVALRRGSVVKMQSSVRVGEAALSRP